MAEAILRHFGGDRFEAYSAGSHPAGFVHELVIDALNQMGIPMDDQKHTSKSWDEFSDKPKDVVITVCDAAAGQTCPVWPGEPLRAHWSLPDPACHLGSDQERRDFALSVAQRLATKIERLVELDWTADRETLSRHLQFLGEI